MKRNPETQGNGKPTIRCAIYTRKSTEEGLDQDFNSLDAQREAGEAFIKSQQHEGWVCLPTRYDDGGFTGGNMDRPALTQLLKDIREGKVDLVVCYKVDRLSRSLLDFAKMMEVFEKHHVSFVSITQQFNSATSMGRLVLNVLLSFAQFEREIISERTRDKIAATRRKGKWTGGHPILGYNIDPQGFKLIVNDEEAQRVRTIFELYLQLKGLVPVVQELSRRGWTQKRWITRKGRSRGGLPFRKTSLHKLLTNVAYIGKVRYKTEVHPGEHAAIVDEAVFYKVQARLKANGHSGPFARNKFGFLLKGLIRCSACDRTMSPSHAAKDGKRYRYYVCTAASKNGWSTCPSKCLPAGAIEKFVIDQIRTLGQDKALLEMTIARAKEEHQARSDDLANERRRLERELSSRHADLCHLVDQLGKPGQEFVLSRLAEVQQDIQKLEGLLAQVKAETPSPPDEAAITKAFTQFDPVWESLSPNEKAEAVNLLIQRIDYDGTKVKIAFNSFTQEVL